MAIAATPNTANTDVHDNVTSSSAIQPSAVPVPVPAPFALAMHSAPTYYHHLSSQSNPLQQQQQYVTAAELMEANPEIPLSYITPPHQLPNPNSSYKRKGKTGAVGNLPSKRGRRCGITAASAAGTCAASGKPLPSLSSSQSTSASNIILCRIRTPNPNDVLCGRGGGINSHPGNRTFRSWVRERKEAYNLAKSKAQKAKLSREIVDRVRNLNPPGRFLMREDRTAGAGAPPPSGDICVSGLYYGWWIEIDDAKAMAKTSQALREGAPSIRAAHKTSPAATTKAAATASKKSPPQEEQTEVGSVLSSPTVIDQQLSALSAALEKAKEEDASASTKAMSTTSTNPDEQNASMESSSPILQSQQQQQQQVGATVHTPDNTASGGSAASSFTCRPLAQSLQPQSTTATSVSAGANAVTDGVNKPLSPASLQHTANMVMATTSAAAPSAPHYSHAPNATTNTSLQGISPTPASTVNTLAIDGETVKKAPFVLIWTSATANDTTNSQPVFQLQTTSVAAPVAATAPAPKEQQPHPEGGQSISVPPPPPLFGGSDTHQMYGQSLAPPLYQPVANPIKCVSISPQPPSSTNTCSNMNNDGSDPTSRMQMIAWQPTKQQTQEASITPPPPQSQNQNSSIYHSAMLSLASTPPPGGTVSSSNDPMYSPAMASITPGDTLRREEEDQRSDKNSSTPTLMPIPLSPTALNMMNSYNGGSDEQDEDNEFRDTFTNDGDFFKDIVFFDLTPLGRGGVTSVHSSDQKATSEEKNMMNLEELQVAPKEMNGQEIKNDVATAYISPTLNGTTTNTTTVRPVVNVTPPLASNTVDTNETHNMKDDDITFTNANGCTTEHKVPPPSKDGQTMSAARASFMSSLSEHKKVASSSYPPNASALTLSLLKGLQKNGNNPSYLTSRIYKM